MRFCWAARVMRVRASAAVGASGLSTTTCLPARRAAVASGTWESLGVVTTMRSSVGSAKASSGVRRVFRAGVGFGGGVAGALDDGGEFEARDGGNEGAMEDFAAEAVADDGGADGVCHGGYRSAHRAEGRGPGARNMRAKWGCGKIFGILVGIFAYIRLGVASVVRNPKKCEPSARRTIYDETYAFS